LRAARGGLQADDPVHPAGALAVDEAVHPQADGFRQPAVPARDGLVGDADDLREQPERRSRRHRQRVQQLPVNGI